VIVCGWLDVYMCIGVGDLVI